MWNAKLVGSGAATLLVVGTLAIGGLRSVVHTVEEEQVRQLDQFEHMVTGFADHVEQAQDRQMRQAWERGDKETAHRILAQMNAADDHKRLAQNQFNLVKAEMGAPVEVKKIATLKDIKRLDQGRDDTSTAMAMMPLFAAGGTLGFFVVFGGTGAFFLLKKEDEISDADGPAPTRQG